MNNADIAKLSNDEILSLVDTCMYELKERAALNKLLSKAMVRGWSLKRIEGRLELVNYEHESSDWCRRMVRVEVEGDVVYVPSTLPKAIGK